MKERAILEVRNLTKYFPVQQGFLGRPGAWLKAVDGVSLSLAKGETLGLVGESGCGKSTLGRCLIGLYQPTAGEIWFKGRMIDNGTDAKYLSRHMQMIFQDPYAALNPRMTVADIIGEPLDIHGLETPRRSGRIADLLRLVGLGPEHANRFPHEFSGGQRQRICIARSIALSPDCIICDEPISALDVSIQAQVVNLLQRLQAEMGLSYLFIAHDLAVVKHISNRVAVMYLGKIVEVAPSYELYARPQHPYSQALLASIPIPDPDKESQRIRISLAGDVPSPVNPPSGCRFRTRCRHALPICAEAEPELRILSPEHAAACHLL